MKKLLKFPLDIQLFADEEDHEDSESKDTDDDSEEGKQLTQEDVDKAVSEARKAWEKEQQEKETEAEKLAKMSTKQQEEYKANQRELNLAKREAELNRRELMATAKETLISKGLPAELAIALDYTDADACNKSIEKIGKAFEDAVQKHVEQKIKGGKTIKSAKSDSDDMTDEEVIYNAMMGK